MATSGAYKNVNFDFCWSFAKASDPTQLFTGTFLSTEVKVITRDGSTTHAAASIANVPVHQSNGVFEINLTFGEMNHDEILVVIEPSTADVLAETISIVTLPTPSDVSEVNQSAVTGVNDFKADTTSLATQASVDSIDTDVQNIGSDVTAVLTDTNELQLNQGNWLTATGFSTHSQADVVTAMQAVANDFKATGFATVNPDNASITAILADTNELQLNQGNWLTATGFSTHSAGDVVTSMQAVAGDFKADISGLSTFNSTTDTVTVGTNNDKTDYVLTQSFPANFSTLIIGTGADAGKVTTSNPAAGSGSNHTAQDVANLILVTPANKLATDASGNVEANNMRGTDNAALATSVAALNDFDPAVDTVANVTTVGSVTSAVTTDAASRTASQADVSALATSAEIAALNVPDAATVADAVWDESLNDHNGSGSVGRALKQTKEGVVSVDGSVSDASPTASVFTTNLSNSNTSFYHDKILVFTSGGLSGQARHIESYNGSTKEITLSEPFTLTPSDGDDFLILATHEHSVDEIQAGLATQASVDTVSSNVDTLVSNQGDITITTAQAQAIADEVLKRSVINTQDSADAHSLAAIILAILESQRSGSTWTIRKTTGTTFTTKNLTLAPGADPVGGVD